MNPDSDDQNIPGLDDLLDSIRGKSGGNKSGALAVYVPDEREEDLVSEQIDERILALLGLEDAIDIDYATYKTLLREKIMEGMMADSKMPTEETEILTEEFKRVKGNTGRFKVKKEKIKFESFVANVKTSQRSRPQSSLLALPGTAEPDVEVGQDPGVEGIQKFLGGISDKLAEIEKNLGDMLDMEAREAAAEKREVDKERVAGEKVKKRRQESKLESGIKGVGKKITEAVVKPVKSLFEQIINFFVQIFLGSLVMNLIKFLENPMTIFNPFIRMINSVIGIINNILSFIQEIALKPVNFIIDAINGGITNLENLVNGIFGLFGEQKDEDKLTFPKIPQAQPLLLPTIPEFGAKPEKKKEPIKKAKGMAGGGLVVNEGPTFNVKQEVGGYTEGGQVTNLNFGNIGGWRGGNTNFSPKFSGFKGGGQVITNILGGGLGVISGLFGGGSITSSSGQTITGMGPDTQLIAAQPGEIVMSKKAVQAYGANNLLAMNKNAGGTNIPTMGSVQGFQGGGMVSVSGDAQYDVIIPLDHVRPENIYNVPDKPGGDTFNNARATGAAGRERDAQDPAVRMIAERMASQGMRVRIYSPEDAGDYQTYDNYLRSQAELGVRILPIHFDAGVDPATGKVVGTGFLTRTRAGDAEDAQFAAPIQKVLEDFQRANPDLGNISQDTAGNATVNVGAASPTALIELGIMTFWEKKYGKDFVNTPEFRSFANNVADAAVQGSGITPSSQPQSQQQQPQIQPQQPMVPGAPAGMSEEQVKAQQTLASINSAMKVVNERRSSNTGSGEKHLVPGVGTYVEGSTMFGTIPVNKYFNLNGEEISKAVFDERLEMVTQAQQAIISKSTPQTTSPQQTQPPVQTTQPTITPSQVLTPPAPPPSRGTGSMVALPGGSQQQRPVNSSTSAGQKEVPSFSSRDHGNTEFIVIKSIYNIVG